MATWIPVLVRQEDYPEITRLIAEREIDRNDGDPITRVREVHDLGTEEAPPMSHRDRLLAEHVPWKMHDLEALAEGKTLTTQRWSRAMDVCSKQPGKWLPTSQIAELAGDMSITEWRDATRKIPRHLQAHYPDVPRDEDGKVAWPLCADDSNLSVGPVWWAITDKMADRWREVRGPEFDAATHRRRSDDEPQGDHPPAGAGLE